MVQAHPITVNLPQDLADKVSETVKNGAFDSASDVVREALCDWFEKQSGTDRDPIGLQAQLQDALDDGPGDPGETVFARLRARYSA